MRKQVLLMMAFGLLAAGCVSTIDPVTGHKSYGLDPKAAQTIDTAAGTVEAVGGPVAVGIGAIHPAAGAIAGVIVGVLTGLAGAWRKWRKPLAEKSELLDKVAAGARAAADVIDEVVKPNLAAWAQARAKLKAAKRAGAIMPDEL